MRNSPRSPTFDDWKEVETLVNFLMIFYNATLWFSRPLYVTSNCFFNKIVLIHIKLLSLKNDGNCMVYLMAENMLKKFDKYQDIENINQLFVVVVLNHKYKLKYIKFWFGCLHKNDMANEMARKVKDALPYFDEWFDDNKPNSVSP